MSSSAAALYDYEAQDAAELSIHEGEILTVHSEPDADGWITVEGANGQGFVPASYIQVCQVATAEYDYDGSAADGELSFSAGVAITVISIEEEGWGFGFVDGSPDVQGSFPANYVNLGAAPQEYGTSADNLTAAVSDFSAPSSVSGQVLIPPDMSGGAHTILEGSTWKPVQKWEMVVGEPQTIGTGMKKFTVYNISCKTTGSSVPRRYSEFVWVRQAMNERFPTIVMPLLPKKQFSGRFDPLFIERRRRNLERFINRISNHPVIRSHKLFQAFLTEADTKKFGQMKKDAAKEKNKGAHFLNSIHAEFPLPLDADNRIQNFEDYLKLLLNNVRKTKDLAKEIVARRLETGTFAEKIGDTFQLLGTVGKESGAQPLVLLEAIGIMKQSTADINSRLKKQSENETFLIQELLKLYTGIIKSFREVLKIRDTTHANYTSTLTRAEKLDPASPKTAALQKQVETIKRRHLVLTHVCLAEITRFHSLRHLDFCDLLGNFAQTQVDSLGDIAGHWGKIMKPLANLPKH